jgi:protoporphyrinogen oxidase
MATSSPTIIIGAGPAGLAAALELSRREIPGVVLEQAGRVGGIAQTVQFDGYRFDQGGHRFFTKVDEIARLWDDLLGPDLLTRPRLSRIYYDGRFFSYPLRVGEAFSNLGLLKSLRIFGSYLSACVRPQLPADNFERWVSNRFGRMLYQMFFRAYTEKVWGIPCTEIGVDWAAQRIRDLSLGKAVWQKLNPFRGKRAAAVSLIEEFRYPRLGPGMMWNACVERFTQAGISLHLGARAVRLTHDGHRVQAVLASGGAGILACGRPPSHLSLVTCHSPLPLPCSHVISTMALPDLIRALDPPPPEDVLGAADGLHFRELLIVALVVQSASLFPDNWIYIHDPTVRVGRVQNVRNWSPEMMPNDRDTVVALEYFCNEGDQLWATPDADLIGLARHELDQLGLLGDAPVGDGVVVRVRQAYPVYDPGYRERVATIREYLSGFENLQTCGRNGLHRYNNLDHSMLTGLYAASNVAGESHDVWSVNADEEYIEQR